MAKIESVHDLPEWFDIKKYQACESFGAADWYEALHCRSEILLYLPYIHSPDLVDSSVQTDIANIRINPLYLPGNERSRDDFLLLPVASLTFGRLLGQCSIERFCKSANSARWGFFIPDFLPDETREEELAAVENMPMIFGRSSAAIVDLGATDSIILESFIRWLKNERASRPGINTSRNKPSYTKWARYGLLAYIDLKLWAIESGNKIPDRVMSRAISGNKNYEMGEENIRKTLTPLANDLMQDLSALRALAAIEHTEG